MKKMKQKLKIEDVKKKMKKIKKKEEESKIIIKR
jgi:hypothetical protein